MAFTGRLVCAGALTLAALAGGPQVAVADGEELRPTRMVFQQGAANVLPPYISGRVFLYDAHNNRPLAGKTIIFTNNGRKEICRAVTDTNGEAGCTGEITLGPAVLDSVWNGYTAHFEGDQDYKPIKSHGPINVVLDPAV